MTNNAYFVDRVEIRMVRPEGTPEVLGGVVYCSPAKYSATIDLLWFGDTVPAPVKEFIDNARRGL